MIDTHIHHTFKAETVEDAQKELDELKLVLSGYEIEQAVLYMIGDHDFERGFYKLDFGEKIIPSCMLDPRLPAPVLEEQIAACCKAGVRMLKLLPYEQHIMKEEYPLVAAFAQIVQRFEMTLTICCAYGSEDIYNTNGVELAAYILERGFTNPLILAHGGMVRVLDTYSLMREYENLYMDISFTLPFWKGSSVIQDYAFVLKRLSCERTFYGSDYPYISMEDSIQSFDWFCKEYQFSAKEKEMLLETNFKAFREEFLI